jgi:hypothetical protein
MQWMEFNYSSFISLPFGVTKTHQTKVEKQLVGPIWPNSVTSRDKKSLCLVNI